MVTSEIIAIPIIILGLFIVFKFISTIIKWSIFIGLVFLIATGRIDLGKVIPAIGNALFYIVDGFFTFLWQFV